MPSYQQLTQMLVDEMYQQESHYERHCYRRYNHLKLAQMMYDYLWNKFQAMFIFPETWSRRWNVTVEGVPIEIEVEEDAYGWHRRKIGDYISEWLPPK